MNIYPADYESKYEYYLDKIYNNKPTMKLFAEEATHLIFESKFGRDAEPPEVTLRKMKQLAYICYLTLPPAEIIQT
jgi:hypothetical protein